MSNITTKYIEEMVKISEDKLLIYKDDAIYYSKLMIKDFEHEIQRLENGKIPKFPQHNLQDLFTEMKMHNEELKSLKNLLRVHLKDLEDNPILTEGY